jgi:hypothetical protein
MSDQMRKILESKHETPKRLSALLLSEKVKLLGQLRDRSLTIADSPLKDQFSLRN